jgi:hypothetical protein
VAEELARRGHQVSVPSLAGFTTGRPPYTPRLLEQARTQLQQSRDPAPSVLTPNSSPPAPLYAELAVTQFLTAAG